MKKVSGRWQLMFNECGLLNSTEATALATLDSSLTVATSHFSLDVLVVNCRDATPEAPAALLSLAPRLVSLDISHSKALFKSAEAAEIWGEKLPGSLTELKLAYCDPTAAALAALNLQSRRRVLKPSP